MPQLITEAVDLSASSISKSGRIRIRIIDQGVGSSGTYPAATLEAAGKDKVFTKGLHMYADHPTAVENMDRPERTIKDLAAVLESDAVFENGGLYADAKVFPNWREVISEMAADIGVSIRATAEVDDSKNPVVITKLVSAESVDFVTKAGRGGRVMEVLESARATSRAVEHGVSEATANSTREWLNDAVRATAGRGQWAHVRDFDGANVYYERTIERPDGGLQDLIYQQGYTLNGNTATLTGDPVEVKPEVIYTPVTQQTAEESATKNSVPNPATVTENQEEAIMATIDDTELTQLRESASRATAAEADITTATDRATRAEEALTKANDRAATAIVEAAFSQAGITAPKTAARLSKGYPVAESGELDDEKLAADVAESIAELAESNGAGQVHGLGQSSSTESKVSESDVNNRIGRAFGRKIEEAK